MKYAFLLALLITMPCPGEAQDYRWQQRAEYSMDITLDVSTHKMDGTQRLVYFNNSPDTLFKVYYHLYFNAFQPGSMMDVRSRTIADPDARVMDRIAKLKENEIGYQRIVSLTQDKQPVQHNTQKTILEVILAKPVLPAASTVFEMTFEAQVPLQIRRSGRDNKEGIAYSMAQWYPKMAEYDHQGWHAYPYVAREFHGVWGDYDVKITIDPKFTVAGSGVLQNPDAIGHGYQKQGVKIKPSKEKLTWHFVARNVHDFAWAADPDYTHTIAQVPNGPALHFFFQEGEKTTANWAKLKDYTIRHFQYMNDTFGKYPYPVYSVIQGGDGGMEYPMCTLITGERSLESLVGVTAHEAAHSWYQEVLGSNELLYPWMDEGFTDFASSESYARLFNQNDAHSGSYKGYFKLVESGLQEPLSQHADHYNTNRAYGTAAYSMGAIFLNQLRYLIGDDAFYRGMRRYFNTWKMRHPEPNDFIRIMEKESSLQLQWYLRYWIFTTKRIDYAISKIEASGNTTVATLQRLGDLPMPVDLLVTYKNGTREWLYLPMNELMGNKKADDTLNKYTSLGVWNWVNPTYTLTINRSISEIESLEIDPSQRMADIDRTNNFIKP